MRASQERRWRENIKETERRKKCAAFSKHGCCS
jgi:hypothetical protein